MQQAFSVLGSGIGRVREFLKSQGFGDAEIGLGAIETEIHYTRDAKGNETREVSSYSLSRRYWVTTREVQRVSRAAGEVTGLIRDGVLVVSAAPQYYYDDLPSLRVTLESSTAPPVGAPPRAEAAAGGGGGARRRVPGVAIAAAVPARQGCRQPPELQADVGARHEACG